MRLMSERKVKRIVDSVSFYALNILSTFNLIVSMVRDKKPRAHFVPTLGIHFVNDSWILDRERRLREYASPIKKKDGNFKRHERKKNY